MNRSRNKSGMTAYGYSENAQFRHSDKAPGRNLDAIASQLSPANKEPSNGEPVCFDLPRPETRFAGLFYLQLTTHNLQLVFRLPFQPLTSNFGFFRSPDPEQEHFTDKMSSSDEITSICLLFFLVFASWHVSASITSPDVLPGTTSSRQRASLPAGGSITSDFDATSLRPPTTVLPRTKNRFLL